MLNNLLSKFSGIRNSILLPVVLVFVSFASIINFYWTPNIIEKQTNELVNRETDVLRALAPTLTKIILNNDIAELYESLDYQIEHDEHGWVQLVVRTPSGKQLYPLEHKSSLQGEYLYKIKFPLIWEDANVATILMTFDMEEEINNIKSDMLSLNLIILFIVSIISAGSLLWQEKSLRNPLYQLKQAATELANGNFNVALNKRESSGEIGELTQAFNNMRDNLLDTHYKLGLTAKRAMESEIRQRSILENISDAIITVNEYGIIESFNPGAEKMFGYSYDEIIGDTLDPIIPKELQNKHRVMMDKQQKSDNKEKFIHNIVTYGQRKDKSVFPINIAINEINIDNKKIFTSIVRDITEEKASKDALIAAKEEAERASDAKSDFLSRMSHELRTPMNAILGFTQVLELNDNEHLHAEDKLHIKEISKAGNHLLELVNEVLDLSKIESGKLDLSMEPVSIQDVLEDCNILMRSIASEHNITLTCIDSPCQNKYVMADRTRMKQVILNLLSNAIKYNKPGGSVIISCEQQDEDYIRLSVKDTGPGISEEHQKEMFRPFNRLWAKNSTIEGVGIGLVITKSFVEKMDGHIGLESIPGTGSTFWFELKQAVTPQDIEEPDNITRLHQYNVNKKNLHTILYIEDNPANLRLVSTILKNENGIYMLTAHEPHLGLEIARSHKPELILLDINLPMMDGYEVLEILKATEATKEIPVIAISANAMHSDIKKGLAAGFDDYIPKPIDIKKLQATVHGYLMNDENKHEKEITTDFSGNFD